MSINATTTSTAELVLTLSLLPRVGRKALIKVLCQTRVPERPTPHHLEFSDLVMTVGGLDRSDIRPLQKIPLADLRAAFEKASTILSTCAREKVLVVAYPDPGFPSLLRSIPDPPALLFIKGDPSTLTTLDGVAVVGTRTPSNHGHKVARQIGARLSEQGHVVISGLAEGIDTAAHLGCLEAGGRTVAVLAHGHAKIYPRGNASLAHRIVENCGCLVSEYPPDVGPARHTFVDRDRLQSGLSSAVLVIETGVKGGTMHTVQYCRDQHRSLWALTPPSIDADPTFLAGYQRLVTELGARSFTLETLDQASPSLCPETLSVPEKGQSSLLDFR